MLLKVNILSLDFFGSGESKEDLYRKLGIFIFLIVSFRPRIIEFRGCVVRTGGGLFKILFDVACSTVQQNLMNPRSSWSYTT